MVIWLFSSFYVVTCASNPALFILLELLPNVEITIFNDYINVVASRTFIVPVSYLDEVILPDFNSSAV